MTKAPLSLVVKTGVLRSCEDLIFGFLPWEALCVRAVENLSGGSRPLTRIVNLLRILSMIDDRHVMKSVVFEFYFVEVAYVNLLL